MSAPAPSAPPHPAVRLSPVAQALIDAQHGGRRTATSQPGALPRGYAASPATRAQQRQLHGGARAYDRSPAGAGWAQRQEHARAAAHARSPAVGVRGGGAAPTEGSGPMPASYAHSPASRSAAGPKPTHWGSAPSAHYSHPHQPPHAQPHQPVHRAYPAHTQHPPPRPHAQALPHAQPPASQQRPPPAQPRLQRAQTAPVNSAARRGNGLDTLGRAHSVAHEEYRPPSGYPGTAPAGHMYPAYAAYPPPHAAYPPPHGAYPPPNPGYVPPPPPGYMPYDFAPPSAARPLDPHRLSALHRNGPRGTAPMREQLLLQNASMHMGGKSLAPSATPMSPAELAARDMAESAAQADAMPRPQPPPAVQSVRAPLPPPRQARPISPEEQLRRRASYRGDEKMVLSRAARDAARDVLRRTKSVAVQSAAPTAGDAGPEPVGNELRRRATAPVAYYKAREKPAWASEGVNGIPKMSPARKGFDRDECYGRYAPSSSRHRAVVVGVTYALTKHNTLNGALSDVREVFKMLVDTFGFAPEKIRVLCDQTPACGEREVIMPTLQNIMEAMRWVNEDAKSGDSMFFYFAGHGSLVKDYSGDERDTEFDQCLVPIDSAQSGAIVDDHIFEWLIRRVPFGARLTCLIDACTSGTVCDLPFLHTRTRGHRRAGLGTDHDIADVAAQPPRHALRPDMRVGETLLYAGSADLQEAVDITRVKMGRVISFGVMTRSFLKAVREVLQLQNEGRGVEHTSFGAHLAIIQNTVDSITREEETLKGTEPQEPQLSSSHRFEIFETLFSL